jgi:hypothetical protein
MITIENIVEYSKPHIVEGGRHTRISNEYVEFSIVGGATGLYGDFINTFELAIFNKDNGEFITKFFNNNDDIIPYMSKENLLELVNNVFRKGFQVT